MPIWHAISGNSGSLVDRRYPVILPRNGGNVFHRAIILEYRWDALLFDVVWVVSIIPKCVKGVITQFRIDLIPPSIFRSAPCIVLRRQGLRPDILWF